MKNNWLYSIPITYEINEKDEVDFFINDEVSIGKIDLDEVIHFYINSNFVKKLK